MALTKEQIKAQIDEKKLYIQNCNQAIKVLKQINNDSEILYNYCKQISSILKSQSVMPVLKKHYKINGKSVVNDKLGDIFERLMPLMEKLDSYEKKSFIVQGYVMSYKGTAEKKLSELKEEYNKAS
ncbi:MAG: hypothetical protein IJY25_01035 [Bacilli bacterium]|nr:hypothetical protein [Bacilli bacterium]